MSEGSSIWDQPKQTFLVENGQVGDCWRCCVAAVLQVPAETVPHFVKESNHSQAETQTWLNERGFVMISSARMTAFGFDRWHGEKGAMANYPVISCGPTRRSQKPGQHHAVVTLGDAVVYDPHPSGAGLLLVVEEYLIVPRYGRVPFIP